MWGVPRPGGHLGHHRLPTPQPQPRQIYVCDLHHSSRQGWSLNPLSEARDGTPNLMVLSWIRFRFTMMGTPRDHVLLSYPSITGYLGCFCLLSMANNAAVNVGV